MSSSRVLLLMLMWAVAASPAWAQDDDDELTPLGPKKKKTTPKKAKPKPKPPEGEVAPPAAPGFELVLKLAPGSAPRRTMVSVDGRELGPLPLSPQRFSKGRHTVVVNAPGFAPWTKQVTLTGKPTEVIVQLQPTAALVSVSAEPGAEVLINGQPVGPVPLEDVEVAPGNATIVVRKDGFGDSTQTLTVVAGTAYPLSVKLVASAPASGPGDRPQQANLTPTGSGSPQVLTTTSPRGTPIVQRWYFWVGVAAVVAAGVAVGTAVGVSNSQPRPLGQQEVCNGNCDAWCVGASCSASFMSF